MSVTLLSTKGFFSFFVDFRVIALSVSFFAHPCAWSTIADDGNGGQFLVCNSRRRRQWNDKKVQSEWPRPAAMFCSDPRSIILPCTINNCAPPAYVLLNKAPRLAWCFYSIWPRLNRAACMPRARSVAREQLLRPAQGEIRVRVTSIQNEPSNSFNEERCSVVGRSRC